MNDNVDLLERAKTHKRLRQKDGRLGRRRTADDVGGEGSLDHLKVIYQSLFLSPSSPS